MNINTFRRNFKICSILLALSLLQSSLIIGQEKFDSEILVYFLPDSLEMGEDVEKLIDVSKLTINSKSLNNTFKTINIKTISKAFPKFNSADKEKTNDDGVRINLPNMSRIFKLELASKAECKTTIEKLLKEKSVLFAEPNGSAQPLTIPNDTHFSLQWGLKNGSTGRDINATQAWNIYKGNSNNIIAIIDGGIDKNHPDLQYKVSGDNGYSWDGHGIHVAGIAAAKTNNSTGISGVDWYAKLHSQRVDDKSDIEIYNAVKDAVDYSSNVKVLNNSWRLLPYGRFSTTVKMAFVYTYKNNRVSVAAMGNYQGNLTEYPAGFGQGIIAVGATDHNDNIWWASNTGNHIDVSAPGVYILSTYRNGNNFPDQNYYYNTGTSMAAPHVSGLASLLKGYKSYLYNDDIENIIRLGVKDLGTTGWDSYYGTGRIDAYKALNYLRSPYTLKQKQSTGGTVVGSTGYYTCTFYGLPYNLPDGEWTVKRKTVEKTVYYSENFTQTPYVWGRGVATVGYSIDSPNFTMGYCEAVPGTVTKTSARLRTYIYELYVVDPYDGHLYLYEVVPEIEPNVIFAYTVFGMTGIEKKQSEEVTPNIITSNKLFDNYPNPFNPITIIKYQLKEPGFVSLKVYDLLGREVANLVADNKEIGLHSIEFDANNLASGLYIYRLKVNDYISSKKMILSK